MARVVDETRSLFVQDDDGDDDLIEVQAYPRPRNASESLMLPRPGRSSARPVRTPSAPVSRASRRHERRPQQVRLGFHRHHSNHPPNQPVAVIDLTEEPDSPEQQRAPQSQSQSQGVRHPRRTASQRLSPPRLARSDSTFMAPPPASFIDLTTDSPENERVPEPLRPRLHRHSLRHHVPPFPDELIQLEMVEDRPRMPLGLSGFAGGFAGRLAGYFGANLMRSHFLSPHLDVTRSPYVQREPTPKPPMEPAPPTRAGFTRDTRAEPDEGVDRVVICPACDEELAYDPTGPAVQAPVVATGKKRKRAPGEHHFWALKKCGHVYCADCFENRKPTKAAPNGVGFPATGSSSSDIRCAVDDCDTKVTNKTEWVGIFL